LFYCQTARAVDVWLTTGDKSQLLAQKSDVVFQPGPGSGGTVISVSPGTTYQTIAGFGAAVTDSSAWLLQNKLSGPARDKLMRQLYSTENGIGLNYMRIPMGASDFTASGFYTYNDNPVGGSDDQQAQFSIAHDQAYIIPQLQQALALNPALKLMASPWSAPAWMKTNNALQGGSLKPEWEASFARYLTKFVQAYEALGLPIDAVTLQNEPLHTTSSYPTMSMSATQQARIIKNNLGPMFASEGVDAKIIAYDHNWDNTSYPLSVLGDPAANPYVAGTAFHAYAGDVSAQTTVHNAYPDKDIYFTEATGGDWATNFGDNIVWNFQNIIIGGTRNWAKTAILWNVALDQNGNPHQGGCDDCRGVVTVNSSTGAVTFNEEFYALGHATIAVQPGAVRIASTTTSGINTVAFRNPDDSEVLIALNPNSSTATMRVYENGQNFTYQIPGKSVATFRWNAQGADFDNGGFDQGGYQQGGGSLDAWTVFGNTTSNVTAAAEAVASGDKSLKLFGQFNGALNTSGVSQGITVTAGDSLSAELSALVRSADSLSGTANLAQMKIEFYSQYSADRNSPSFLSETSLTIADAASLQDQWFERQLTGVAPVGAAEARLVLQFVQPSNQSGAVHIDDVLFGVAPRAIAGDYNRDGVVDGLDLETWTAALESGSLQADGNKDGEIDGADLMIWQQNLQPHGDVLPATATVPEPSGKTLACVSSLAATLCWRRCYGRMESANSARVCPKNPPASCDFDCSKASSWGMMKRVRLLAPRGARPVCRSRHQLFGR
jgi:glucosylceramidase